MRRSRPTAQAGEEGPAIGRVHQLVPTFGKERARQLAGPEVESRLLGIVGKVLPEESRANSVTYAGFCLISLPRRRLPDEHVWKRASRCLTLMIEPRRLSQDDQLYGVPYGSRALLINFVRGSVVDALRTCSALVHQYGSRDRQGRPVGLSGDRRRALERPSRPTTFRPSFVSVSLTLCFAD